jgi:hypothetical protein
LALFSSGFRKRRAGLPDLSCYNIPKREKIFQKNRKYTKRPNNIQNEHEIYQHLPLQDPPKFTQIWTFGLKMPENISGGV